VHSSYFSAISLGQNVTSNNIYCSAQCICYDQDSNISNNDVQSRHSALLENNKLQLRSLARSLGMKISYRPPGQASKDLSKEGIVQQILEKQLMNDLATAGVDESTAATLPATEVPSVVTIHDNFCLVNVMFCTEITEISNWCRSAATRNELDANISLLVTQKVMGLTSTKFTSTIPSTINTMRKLIHPIKVSSQSKVKSHVEQDQK
jgi:hypothetical protein